LIGLRNYCFPMVLVVLIITSAVFISEGEASYYLKDSSGESIYLAGYGPYLHIRAVNWDYASFHTKLQDHHINFYRLWPLHGFYEDEDIVSGKHQLIYSINRDGKCDLTSFNQDYWNDLKSLLADARDKGIYVEISLFDDCSLEAHLSSRWTQHPFNKDNNTNGVFDFGLSADNERDFYNLDNSALLYYQELYVEKLIGETWPYDNVIYEVINEGDAGEKWIKYWVNFIDKGFDRYITDREPIIAHNAFPINNPIYTGFDNPDIDLINWHTPIADAWEEYTRPDFIESLFKDHSGVKPQSYDEGPSLPPTIATITDEIRRYARRKMWFCFVNAGYVNIKHGLLEDYAYPVAYVDEILLDYFQYFGDFRANLDFGDMTPDHELVATVPSGVVTHHTLADPGDDYVVYITGSAGVGEIRMDIVLGDGFYIGKWFDPKKGEFLPIPHEIEGGGKRSLELPKFNEDIVLYLTRREPEKDVF